MDTLEQFLDLSAEWLTLREHEMAMHLVSRIRVQQGIAEPAPSVYGEKPAADKETVANLIEAL